MDTPETPSRRQPRPQLKPGDREPDPALAEQAAARVAAILHRWTPQRALAGGWQLWTPALGRSALGHLALFGLLAVAAVVLALWLAVPDAQRLPTDLSPLQTVPWWYATVLLPALIFWQWGIARFGYAVAERLSHQGTGPAKPTLQLEREWAILPAIVYGTLPKVLGGGVAAGLYLALDGALWRADITFAVTALVWLWIEARFAFWPFIAHRADYPTLATIGARCRRLSRNCQGRLLTIYCLLLGGAGLVGWLLALVAGSAGIALAPWAMAVAVGLAVALVQAWLLTTLGWAWAREAGTPTETQTRAQDPLRRPQSD